MKIGRAKMIEEVLYFDIYGRRRPVSKSLALRLSKRLGLPVEELLA